jgi:hypothetical protein
MALTVLQAPITIKRAEPIITSILSFFTSFINTSKISL